MAATDETTVQEQPPAPAPAAEADEAETETASTTKSVVPTSKKNLLARATHKVAKRTSALIAKMTTPKADEPEAVTETEAEAAAESESEAEKVETVAPVS